MAAGSAVPVGAPIGRWDVGDIKVSLDAPNIEARADSRAAPPDTVETPIASPAMQPRGEGARILATPFARRLARQAASIFAT